MRDRDPHILYVEDNPADVHLTTLALQESHRPFTLDVARDGEEALACLKREGLFAQSRAPDLVILDLNLPRLDGASVLAFIRRTPTLTDLPVVIFSSAPLDAARAQAVCHIEKPVDLDGFLHVGQRVWEYWDRRRDASKRDADATEN